MATPVIARWNTLQSLVESANGDCTVFSPYYSSDGLMLLHDALPCSATLTIWTRLSLQDWAHGAADPETLCTVLSRMETSNRTIQLFTNQFLHAKAYFADASQALVGSANLSAGGFARNVELMVALNGQEAADALNVLTVASTPRSVLMGVEALAQWITKYKKLVKRARTDLRRGLKALNAAQRDTETTIAIRPIVEPTLSHLEAFVEWLAKNRNLSGAAHLVRLHNDRIVQRQQGHVKQCFCGTFRFLQEYPTWIQRLSETADSANGMLTPEGLLLNEWIHHMESHANVSSDLFSYSTLRALLPPNRGGTHKSGGGASATLRRVLPLVARFLMEGFNATTK